MSRLYPPSISGALPSFYGNKLKIPYQMNKIVSTVDVIGFHLRLKSASTETTLFELKSTEQGVQCSYTNTDVLFTLKASETKKLALGEYYKIQLAYVDRSAITGYFSTISVIKYTGKPSAVIEGFEDDALNDSAPLLIGSYTNDGDPTEKDYEFRFQLYDTDRSTILDDTGWKIHLSDTDYTVVKDAIPVLDQLDQYQLRYIFDPDTSYYIQYIVRTNNDMIVTSPLYEMVEGKRVPISLEANLIAELDPSIENVQFNWYKSETPPNLSRKIKKNIEYILVYEKLLGKVC